MPSRLMAIKILLLTNSSPLKEFVRAVLQPLGCEIIPATSVALALFLCRKNYPGLVLTELRCSDGTGLDLIRDIKADTEIKETPVIVITSESLDALSKAEAVALGAEKVIDKMAEPLDLLEGVIAFLRERKDERAPQSPE